MKNALLLLALGTLGAGCRTSAPAWAAPKEKLAVKVVNQTPGAISNVSCQLAGYGGGFGGGTSLNPGASARFAAQELESASVSVEVRWTANGPAERIDLGTVNAPGTTLHLFGPGSHQRGGL